MLHLTRGTSFLLLFMFLISLVHHISPSSCSDPGPVVNISHGIFHSRLKNLPFLTSNVTGRHRGPKRKLRAGYRVLSLKHDKMTCHN